MGSDRPWERYTRGGGGGSWGGGGGNRGPRTVKCNKSGCYEGKVTCQKCEARGVVAHKRCLGTGHYPLGSGQTCWGCNGLGDVTCNKCDGHGEFDCPKCGGTGEVTLSN